MKVPLEAPKNTFRQPGGFAYSVQKASLGLKAGKHKMGISQNCPLFFVFLLVDINSWGYV